MHAYLTHPDWPHLLAAIRATPEDDLPRLVAADWLDEHREGERAELIRLGCEFARLTDAAARADTSHRIYELGERLFRMSHGRQVLAKDVVVGYDRGFFHRIHAPFDWWAERADVICAESVGLTVGLVTAGNVQYNGGRVYLDGFQQRFADDECFMKSLELGYCPNLTPGIYALTWPTVAKWETQDCVMPAPEASYLVLTD